MYYVLPLLLFKMLRALVDVDFLYNDEDFVFAKKVLICGITAQSKSYVKTLKRKLKNPAFVIVNTGDSDSPGEHWLAFWFPKSGRGELFDSFGNSPLNSDFIEFLQRNCSSYIYNEQRLQADFSTCCGQWCCVYMYILQMCR